MMIARSLQHFLLAMAIFLPFAASAQDAARTTEIEELISRARQESARGNHSAALSAYVRVIARKPDDSEVLLAAGNEALAMGDSDAAFGFLGRAVTLSPRNAAARAAYGTALTLTARPKDALTLFDQAVRLGIDEEDIAGDRGLARDLLGESKRAQRDYKKALESASGDVVLTQRLALSYAISGDRNAALDVLKALPKSSQTRDVARTQAFVHALTGDLTGARRIAMAHLPGGQADAMTPFFARISVLSAAEKAAAVHLGRLPMIRLATNDRPVPQSVRMPDEKPSTLRAVSNGDTVPPEESRTAETRASTAVSGRRSPSAGSQQAPSAVAQQTVGKAATQAVIPAESGRGTRSDEDAALRYILAEDCAVLNGRARSQCEGNARALARRCTASRARPTAECVAYAARSEPRSEVPAKAAVKTGGDRKASGTSSVRPLTADTLIAAECSSRTGRAQAQCEADIRALARRCTTGSGRPTAECVHYTQRLEGAAKANEETVKDKTPVQSSVGRGNAKAATGAGVTQADPCAALSGQAAVQCRADTRALARRCGRQNPPRTAECIAFAEGGASVTSASARAKPVPERHWVQIAGGRNRSAFNKEWSRLRNTASALLRKQSPYVGKNGDSFRLVVGPFDDTAAARTFVNKLAASGISAFPWTSRAGEAVDLLGE